MQKLLREYLDELNRKQKRRRKTVIAVVLAAIMLVSGVIWNLTQYGIAMTDEPKCGMEEHTHSDSCYTNVLTCGREESEGHTHTDACYQTVSELICGQEESEEHTHSEACYQTVSELICGQEESEGHTHTDACYEKQLSCGKEEHTHSEACYIDTTADVEDASIWNAQYADTKWKDAWGEDLVIAAKKQIGYKESTDNYTVAADGSHKGYTRYGEFAGDVYADWDAAFVNFCMHYAGLEDSHLFPAKVKTDEWYKEFTTAADGAYAGYLTEAAGYEPQVGDVVFFQRENEETDDQMGIVASYNKEKNEIKVIEGNSANKVKENKYAADDTHITAYLKISELETAYKNSGIETNEETVEQTEEVVEPVAAELNYEDDQISVKVTAAETGIIPEGANLKVVPIVADEKETADQYKDVEAKLQEKAEEEEYDIAGFLAYDISFVDADGNKLEPNGKVNVSMDYKSPELPQKVAESETTDTEIKVLHLEEDEAGAVKQVVDMSAEQTATVDTLATTEGTKVQSVKLETESFSVYSIMWGWSNESKVVFHYVDKNGKDILSGSDSNIQYSGNNNRYIPLAIKHIEGYKYVSNRIEYKNSFGTNASVQDIKYLIYNSGLKYKKDGSSETTIGKKTVDVYLVYDTDSSSSTGGQVDPLTAPEHHKYIKYNGDDDYTLTLDVKGTKSSSSGADVLLVLDASGSMGSGYNNLVTTLKNQVENLAKTLLDDNDINQMAVVSFSSKKDNGENYKGETYIQDWTKNSGDLIKTICGQKNSNRWTGGLQAEGGTNWQGAMIKAENMLNNANDSNKKYVIFISDGQPTKRYQYLRTESQTNVGYEIGDGNNDDGRNFDAAVAQFEVSPKLRDTEMYAMYLTDGTKDAMEKFAEAVGAHIANGIGTNFDATMKEIADAILYNAYENVNIEDTLSEYVEFADEPQWSVTKNGNPLDTSKYALTYDITNKTISLIINEELEQNAVYSVSAHIRPTQKAYEEYAEEGDYPHKGDANTDALDNETSSGKKGFYSNAHTGEGGKAIVNYKEKANNESKKAYYDHPVVQVSKVNLDLKKTTKNDISIDGAKFDLYKYNNSEWEMAKESIEVKNDSTKELAGLLPGLYKLTEVQAPTSCMLLGEDIYFKVGNKTVTLIDEDGDEVNSQQDMWKLEEGELILTIKNNVVYDLPSAGGPGIYWYIFSGILLMAGALLIIYKNKCKEVLKS